MSPLEKVIVPRERDLGGFKVRRILPFAQHRMVGPFVFFDHMGPAEFSVGGGMDVRPHPHINLATVTYLFEGSILHRDSLGSEQLIEPGAINWMTAGKGIVHSERTPSGARAGVSRLHGLQCWVALPQEREEIEPSFCHYPANDIPSFREGPVEVKLLVGKWGERKSPVRTESEVIYAEVHFASDGEITISAEGRELAAYILHGDVQVNGEAVPAGAMAVAKRGDDLKIQAKKLAGLMILGGAALPGERHIFWNFVSSSPERIERAKRDWRERRFPLVPGDESEFIPLPE